jgi:hypothetical protein
MDSVFDNRGEYGALEWYQRALGGYDKTLGKDHPSTVNNIGIASSKHREYGKALEWY